MSKRYSMPIPFGWYGVAFGADLKIGEVKPLRYFGKELVLFRTESGEAKVLDAYCPHLGAHLGHGGKVHGESIACPFHGWEFNGGGQCTKVPYAKNMPPKVTGGKQAVYAYPTVEKNQVIWTWYHPDQVAPLFEVEDIAEATSDDWTPLQRFNWTINTTVQEMAENAADGAHFVYVHSSPEMPVGDMVIEGHKRRAEYDMGSPASKADGSLDPDGNAAGVHLDTRAAGPGQTYQRFTGSFETLLMAMPVPIDQNTVELHFAFTQPKNATPEQQAIASMVVNMIAFQAEQDIPIWEHKVYLESPTLCDGDGPIHQHRKWFRQFYAEGDTTAPERLRAV
jgi:3-ketosteroid 9alpha-monooxygenase subunit A